MLALIFKYQSNRIPNTTIGDGFKGFAAMGRSYKGSAFTWRGQVRAVKFRPREGKAPGSSQYRE